MSGKLTKLERLNIIWEELRDLEGDLLLCERGLPPELQALVKKAADRLMRARDEVGAAESILNYQVEQVLQCYEAKRA